MKITINWGELKTTGAGKKLFDGSFIGEDGKEFDATIWETDKDNKVFPGFADLKPGHVFEGNPWKSPTTGKTSIYPPKPAPVRGTGGGANVAKAMERKEKSIEKFQDSKESSIKLAGAMRDAVQLAIAELEGKDKSALAQRILNWRNWIIENWGDEKDVKSPF